MLLCIDVGNTETVVGLFRGDSVICHWRLSSQTPRTADEVFIIIKQWFAHQNIELSEVTGYAISSVVPELTYVFETIAVKYFKLKPYSVTSDSNLDIRIDYHPPFTVGADRICNAIAGYHFYQGPLIVVDFGTAITFDVISEDGAYLGGIITLGLTGLSQALHTRAAKLPKVDLAFPDQIVGTTTEGSIKSGILWGTMCMIDGLVNKIENERGWKDVKVIATGGMAKSVIQYSNRISEAKPFLTLQGIRLLYNKVVKGS